MTEQVTELRECPFCGAPPEADDELCVWCVNVDCVLFDGSKMTVEQWNTRAAPPEPPADLAPAPENRWCRNATIILSAGAALPVTIHPSFIHRPGDDDSSAVTFWGKQDLRKMLSVCAEMKKDINDWFNKSPPAERDYLAFEPTPPQPAPDAPKVEPVIAKMADGKDAFEPYWPPEYGTLQRQCAAQAEQIAGLERHIHAQKRRLREKEDEIVVRDGQIAGLRAGLESIAANTCCDSCQEATLVARAALAAKGAK